MLRSENGGEYTSIEIRDFCGSVGIKRELIVSYKPKKNGVEIGNNKTIVGVDRVMMHDQSVLVLFVGRGM